MPISCYKAHSSPPLLQGPKKRIWYDALIRLVSWINEEKRERRGVKRSTLMVFLVVVPEKIAEEGEGGQRFIRGHHMTRTTYRWKGESRIGDLRQEALHIATDLSGTVSGVKEPGMSWNFQLKVRNTLSKIYKLQFWIKTGFLHYISWQWGMWRKDVASEKYDSW